MVLSQIFQYLTRKQVNDTQTIVPNKTVMDIFLGSANVSKVAIAMYNSMQIRNRPDYFKYRDMIGDKMREWVWRQKLPADDIDREMALYTAHRFNVDFISAHKSLIKRPDVIYSESQKLPNLQDGGEINRGYQADTTYTVMPDNVWRDQFKLTTTDYNGNIIQATKAGGHMLAQDYQNLDVWSKQEVYADFDFEKFRSFRDKYGYVNSYKKIPWHIDHDPDTFSLPHRDPKRASLADTPRQAYGNDEYWQAKNIR